MFRSGIAENEEGKASRWRRILRERRQQRQQQQELEQQQQQQQYDDAATVQTTITVETRKTSANENRKPIDFRRSSQVVVHSADPVGDLESARNDIAKLSIYLKSVPVTQEVAASFLSLIRGDNRTWESIAVDILRQKARWESIVLEDCSSPGNQGYLDMLIGFILNLDNCAFLNLSNIAITSKTAWVLQSLTFTNSLNKLQLDLIDLSPAIPMMVNGLRTNKSVTTLIASRCGLNDNRLEELLMELPTQLEELRLFGNKCRSKGLDVLALRLQIPTCALKVLDVSFQHVDDGDDGTFDISKLATALASNHSLRTLDMDNDSIDDSQLEQIVTGLTQNDTLEELMLNHNKISSVGIATMAARFVDMKGLKKISMYSNLFDAKPYPSPNGTHPAAAPSPAESDKTVGPTKRASDFGTTSGSSIQRSESSESFATEPSS